MIGFVAFLLIFIFTLILNNMFISSWGVMAPQIHQTSLLDDLAGVPNQINEALFPSEKIYSTEELYDLVGDSVVSIESTFTTPNGQTILGTGSGFFYDLAGHIVTADHVVSGSDKITVNWGDNTANAIGPSTRSINRYRSTKSNRWINRFWQTPRNGTIAFKDGSTNSGCWRSWR